MRGGQHSSRNEPQPMKLYHASAFSSSGRGGNPAGVAICSQPLSDNEMLSKARELGYSETVFLHRLNGAWRVRYFAPEIEVPFCGHATVAAGVVLGLSFGASTYQLQTNFAQVPVTAYKPGKNWMARFVSPNTHSALIEAKTLQLFYDCFGIRNQDLDASLPSRLIHAGANHALIALNSRRRLSHIGYAFEELLALQKELRLATVNLVYRESGEVFHCRNAFAIGGVYEDPATGAAAAALAGYLRELGIKKSGALRVIQGEDMGKRSEIFVDYEATPGSGVGIAGEVRVRGEVEREAQLAAVD